MRVLHLPSNVASQMSITVRALRDIGVDAKGIAVNNHPIQGSEGIRNFKIVPPRRHPLRWIAQTLSCWRTVKSAIHWADVVHWYSDSTVLPLGLDVGYINHLNKPRIVHFWGSEIRIPEIASADNPYKAHMQRLWKDRYPHESYKRSIRAQSRFATNGFECMIASTELLAYIQQGLFPSPFRTEVGLILSEFRPRYPDPNRPRPIVVHTPSRPMTKGTSSVLRAIERLKTLYDFEFKLIHDVLHSTALAMVQDCDIMLDQFVIGANGVSALEAMAMGKPVLCYIKPSLIDKFPSDFPIINANQDNLVQTLGCLLEDGRRRNRIGRLSRAYVEKYHDAHEIARQLETIYKQLLSRKPTCAADLYSIPPATPIRGKAN